MEQRGNHKKKEIKKGGEKKVGKKEVGNQKKQEIA